MEKIVPKIIVFSTLFPSDRFPLRGCFIYQRVHRLYSGKNIVVVSPQPWFPFQGFLSNFHKNSRVSLPIVDQYNSLRVFRPRFFSFPLIGKWLDPFFIAAGSFFTVKRLIQQNDNLIIDSHFAFPDGVAGSFLSYFLKVKLTITLRGTEVKHSAYKIRRYLIKRALKSSSAIIGVSKSLVDSMKSLHADNAKYHVIGNGVDTNTFSPCNRCEARENLGFNSKDIILITVGGLVPRKGQHIIIEILPRLIQKFGSIKYLLIGGGSGEGDYKLKLEEIAKENNVTENVIFLGTKSPDVLKEYLSAADLFILASSNEGWANVILESMACGTPVLATDVGGNKECREQ